MGLPYKETLGVSRVVIGLDGLPAVIVWIHVDNIFIHGPTFAKTMRDQTHLLDMALWCCLVAKPEKTKPPPANVNSTAAWSTTPLVRPPTSFQPRKGTRAKSLVDYVWDSSVRVCCAGLAILLGVLESSVRDTPNRQGNCFLYYLNKNLHPEGFCLDNIKEGFNKVVIVSPASLQKVEWWSHLLPAKLGFRIQPTNLVTLCATWGDGSGTGTGDTA